MISMTIYDESKDKNGDILGIINFMDDNQENFEDTLNDIDLDVEEAKDELDQSVVELEKDFGLF